MAKVKKLETHLIVLRESELKNNRKVKLVGGKPQVRTTQFYDHLIAGNTLDYLMGSLDIPLSRRRGVSTWQASNNLLKKLGNMKNVRIVPENRKVEEE